MTLDAVESRCVVLKAILCRSPPPSLAPRYRRLTMILVPFRRTLLDSFRSKTLLNSTYFMIWRKQWHLHWNETGDMQGSEKGLVVPPPWTQSVSTAHWHLWADFCVYRRRIVADKNPWDASSNLGPNIRETIPVNTELDGITFIVQLDRGFKHTITLVLLENTFYVTSVLSFTF